MATSGTVEATAAAATPPISRYWAVREEKEDELEE
jgi:hypothetical protein